MRYLVTGGAGFIGTNIVKELLKRGHGVRVLDNFSAGDFNRFPERKQTGAEYIHGDIRDAKSVAEAMQGIDGVFHEAAVPRVPYSVEHPDISNEHNVTGTLNVLLGAREARVKRVVFASSSSVYGGCEEGEDLTEDMPKNPKSPYALQKLAGQEYCRLFSELYKLETVALCYFNIYGSYMDPNGAYALVIGKFLQQRKNGEPMTICGDGEYYRDYTHVWDVVAANILAMESTFVGKGEMINIGNNTAYSVNNVADLIGGATVQIPERPGDPRYSRANNTRAKEWLKWQSKITLEKGIARMKGLWGIN
ncbi:MAG: NAD-dependent epimerase/dehydratase family protein [Patescibacteria group bacterium]